MLSERIELFGNHYPQDSCKTVDMGQPLGVLRALGIVVFNRRETAKNLLKYGLWGFRFPAIAREGLKNIQEFIRQGGTQVEHPLVLTPPTIFDVNNYPPGTYLRTYLDLHLLSYPKTPDFIINMIQDSRSGLRGLQIRDMDYIVGQFVGIGVVTQAPNPNERFIIYSVGSDLEILQGKYGYYSSREPFRIGEWFHYSLKVPHFLGLGFRLDLFGSTPKVEILQAGETETEIVPAGKRVFAPMLSRTQPMPDMG